MKKSKKFLCLLLALVMAGSLLLLPAAAANTQSVGPLSSACDRACELYAQLTGTTVDYGAAHAAEYGHARYGATYDKPLFAGWSASKKINLVGHSFGGATIRLFIDILADGSAEEQAAAKAAGPEVSPF